MTAPSSKKNKLVYVVLVIVLAVVAFLVIWGQLQSRLSVGAAFGGLGLMVNHP
ncbi:hypothetical protein [Leminorella grimontii]|uniref:hypothetical protein n=1 Tax=Leminorella grimontii TaxID=82981 RepID=UPI0032202970